MKAYNIKMQKEYLELQDTHSRLKLELSKTDSHYVMNVEREVAEQKTLNRTLR